MGSPIGLIPLPFDGGFYQTRSRPLSFQRCINWYLNYPSAKTLNEYNLYHCAGLIEVTNTGDGLNRGGCALKGIPYFVNGQKLFRVNRIVNADLTISFDFTEIGSIAGSGRVQMAALSNQLCIVVPGVAAYIYVAGGALSLISDPDFDGPVDDVVSLDGVFVFSKTNSNIVFHSQINDGLSYDALDSYPVPQLSLVVGLGVFRNQLYVFGETITIPFSNIQGLQFLFSPIPNAVIDTGLRTKYTKTLFRQSYVWLGSGDNAEPGIWLYAGGEPQKISNEPIDYIVQNLSDEELERSFMLRHSQNGAEFIVFNVADYCFKYDLTASRIAGRPVWHEQRSRIPAGSDYIDSVWRVNSIVRAYNKVLVGDSVDGRIGEISDAAGTEYDINMACRLDMQPLSNNGVRSKVSALEVFTDVGVGSNDPINLSWSDDGGFTYSNKLEEYTGEIGDYGRRVVFNRLGGFSNARMPRIEYSGSYPRGINKIMGNAQ